MSDIESRHEDAKREWWEESIRYGDRQCPKCRRAMYVALHHRQTLTNPGETLWRCDYCGEEEDE
jgi:RNase P subunit RPR2